MSEANMILKSLLLALWLAGQAGGQEPNCSPAPYCNGAGTIEAQRLPQTSQAFDVPAVQAQRVVKPERLDSDYLVGFIGGCKLLGLKVKGTDCVSDVWSCADTRRVLLTAEDGTKHCVLLEAMPKPQVVRNLSHCHGSICDYRNPTLPACHYAQIRTVNPGDPADQGDWQLVEVCEESK